MTDIPGNDKIFQNQKEPIKICNLYNAVIQIAIHMFWQGY